MQCEWNDCVVIALEEFGMGPVRIQRFLRGGVATCKHSNAQVNMGIRLFVMWQMRTYLAWSMHVVIYIELLGLNLYRSGPGYHVGAPPMNPYCYVYPARRPAIYSAGYN